MKSPQRLVIIAAALFGLSGVYAQSQPSTPSNPSSTTTTQEAQRGVPGVDVDINRSRNDRGLPGVDASVGADGDQRNVDTRRMGAAPAPADTDAERAARADRN